MKAMRVYLDTNDTDWLGGFVESINEEEDIVVTMVCRSELFIAAENTRAMGHARLMLDLSFGNDFSVQIVK